MILEEMEGDRCLDRSLVKSSQGDFAQTVDYVLNKNTELYRRLG